ncbi:hypothetical protein CHS0354_026897 [Potamilus streckersoni]|uniref:Uncharacterized protein n=1 Tax=Potamilus streckersoni TaxID=2493646 RepID=A0AAE0VZL8_9BIVA|nr:hypothetical protein CHS0354_026897 [Potamilus streckersoni]
MNFQDYNSNLRYKHAAEATGEQRNTDLGLNRVYNTRLAQAASGLCGFGAIPTSSSDSYPKSTKSAFPLVTMVSFASSAGWVPCGSSVPVLSTTKVKVK